MTTILIKKGEVITGQIEIPDDVDGTQIVGAMSGALKKEVADLKDRHGTIPPLQKPVVDTLSEVHRALDLTLLPYHH